MADVDIYMTSELLIKLSACTNFLRPLCIQRAVTHAVSIVQFQKAILIPTFEIRDFQQPAINKNFQKYDYDKQLLLFRVSVGWKQLLPNDIPCLQSCKARPYTCSLMELGGTQSGPVCRYVIG